MKATPTAITTSLVLAAACGGRTGLGSPHVLDAAADAPHDAPVDVRLDSPPSPPDAAAPCTRQVLADGVDPNNLWQDGDYVYFTTDGKGVSRVPKAGGAIQTYAPDESWNVTTDDAYVYWTAFENSVARAPKAGGPVEILAKQSAFGLALDATNVYVADNYDSIWTVPKTGGSPTTLATVPGSQIVRVVVDAANVYATVWGDLGGVIKVDVHGGPVVPIASSRYSYTIAMDATSVYWTSQDLQASGTFSVDKAGATAPFRYSNGGTPDGVAVDDAFVYWADLEGAGVYKSPKGVAAPVLLDSATYARAVTVDDSCVYYTVDCCLQGQGQVVRIPK